MRDWVRDIPDFPAPGIVFRDITPLLGNAAALSTAVDLLVVAFGRGSVEKVCGIEARGFILAAPVAYHAGAGFVPIRKAGKLPSGTVSQDFTLEYDTATLEVHDDALLAGERVVIVDDVLATGGTAEAAATLVEHLGATVVGLGFLIELDYLGGRERLAGRRVESLLRYPAP